MRSMRLFAAPAPPLEVRMSDLIKALQYEGERRVNEKEAEFGNSKSRADRVADDICPQAARRIEQLERELADARSQPEGLSKWEGWDQSNLPWSHCHHQDAVCAAVF